MERAIIQENAAQIYHTTEIPPALLEEANSLYLSSRSSLILKPNQELARTHICCVLAGEKVPSPPADISRPPIPPAQYQKLLKQFRSALIPPSTPKRAKRKTRADVSKYIEPEEENTRYDDDDEFELKNDDLNLELNEEEADFQLDEEEEEFLTPRKVPPASNRYGSPSPRKPSTRSARGVQPKIANVEELAEEIGLEEGTQLTVVHAFTLYEDLVKEKWGLVYGLLVVITDRTEPCQGTKNEWRINRVFDKVCPIIIDKPEWRSWCERIVRNQSWLSKYAQKSENTLDLIGSAGGWGMGVEFELAS